MLATISFSACTPGVNAACDSNAQCRAGESCEQGLCIAANPDGGPDANGLPDGGSADSGVPDSGTQDAGHDAGTPDAGKPDAGEPDAGTPDSGTPDSGVPDAGSPDAGSPDAGGPDAGAPDAGGLDAGPLTLDILTPAEGIFVGRDLALLAQVVAATPPTDVTFVLTVGGADAGALTVSAPATGTTNYGGNLSPGDPSLHGAATVGAVAHRPGGGHVTAAQINVTLDQEAPVISTSWDGGPWVAKSGTFNLNAAISDDLSGVASAQLLVIFDGGLSYPGTIVGNAVSFAVNASAIALPGNLSTTPFSLSATDRVHNVGTQGPSFALHLRVDDQPPVITPNVSSSWFNGSAAIGGLINDQGGSGIDSTSLQLLAGGTVTPGVVGINTFTVATNFGALVGPGFEGAFPYQVTARDLVGNGADAGGMILVDTTPPGIGVFQAVTGPDATNSTSGIPYYKATGPDLSVQVQLDGGAGSPLATSATLSWPAVSGCATSASSTGLAGGSYPFIIPRCAGTGAEGPITFTLAASDTAGNLASAELNLAFDNVGPQIGAVLVTPTDWVARTAPPNSSTLTVVPVQVDVVDNGVGVASAQGVVLGTPYGTATTKPTSGTLWTVAIDTSSAAANTAMSSPFQIIAIDGLGNPTTKSFTILVDDVPPVISPDTENRANDAWHSTAAGNLSFTPSLIISDVGSGVGSAPPPGLAFPGNSPVVTAAPQGNDGFLFTSLTLPSTASMETDSYPMTATASDRVGNPTTATVLFKLDNKAPTYTVATIPTAFVTDTAGHRWFAGAGLISGSVEIDASLTETYLQKATADFVYNAVKGSVTTGCDAQAPTHTCKFLIPRPAVSSSIASPFNVTLNATDLASNAVATPQTLVLYFDNAKPSSANITSDRTWHAITDTITVTANLPSLPASGLNPTNPIQLVGAGSCAAINPTSSVDDGSGGKNLTFSLPANCATAGSEGPLNFNIKVTSLINVSSSQAGFRNVDDAPPKVPAAMITVDAPAAASGPLSWSQTGSLFTRNYNGKVISFSAYDCGAGINTTLSSPSVASLGASVTAIKLTSASVYWLNTVSTCGFQADVWRFDLSANLGAIPASSLTSGTSTSFSWSTTIVDALNGTHHQTALQQSNVINVTRKLWQTSNVSATSLTLGPSLIASTSAGLQALSTSTGANQWTYPGYSGSTSVGLSGGAATVYFLNSADQLTFTINSLSSSSGAAAAGCSRTFAANADGASSGIVSLALTTAGRPAAQGGIGGIICSDPSNPPTICNFTGDSQGWFGGATCDNWWTGGEALETPAVFGRGGASYCVSTGRYLKGSRTGLTERLITAAVVGGNSSACGKAKQMIVGDNGGSDAVYCDDDSKWTFSGTTFTSSWTAGNPDAFPYLVGPGLTYRIAAHNGAVVCTSLTNGSSVCAAGNATPWLIDATAGQPILYSSAGNVILTGSLGSSGPTGNVWDLPTVPGATVTDALMDKSGILYVASGGFVSAIITDSPGLGTSGNAWPIDGHDACRSNNLEYACPY